MVLNMHLFFSREQILPTDVFMSENEIYTNDEANLQMKWFRIDFMEDGDLFNLNMFNIYITVYSGNGLAN